MDEQLLPMLSSPGTSNFLMFLGYDPITFVLAWQLIALATGMVGKTFQTQVQMLALHRLVVNSWNNNITCLSFSISYNGDNKTYFIEF